MVRAQIEVPLAVKLSQHITGLSSFARRAEDAGANGLVLFNRFYGAEVDLDALAMTSRLALSQSGGAALPAAMDRHPACPAARAVLGGDHRRPLRSGRCQGAAGRCRRRLHYLGRAPARTGWVGRMLAELGTG